ncbi:MAG: hypothetical protein JWN76_3805 [Chitinophagaceae bacterium]|nr:hypothetical protein [Chitinophagaceae bacterium]
MNIDINEVIKDMVNAMKGSFSKDWHLVKDTAEVFFTTRKERLESLANSLLEKEISPEFFLKRTEDEKKILESELAAIQLISKAAAERAANAAIEVFQKAVQTALGAII